jgi:hypothetical protein
VNKFYFYSLGNWITKSKLLQKIYPDWIKKKYSQEQRKEIENKLDMILVALLSTSQAISKEEDGLIRFKFTGDPKIHLDFLNNEEKFLQERLDWVREKKQYFTILSEEKN